MSLVAYDNSDESSEEEGNECPKTEVLSKVKDENSTKQKTCTKLSLPDPKCDNSKIEDEEDQNRTEKIHFEMLPKPRSIEPVIEEEEDDLPKKMVEIEKPVKKDRVRIQIKVPCLSEFKDVEEESEKKRNRIMPSKTGTGLFALLPPPKGMEVKTNNKLVPRAVAKNAEKDETQDVKRSPAGKPNSAVRNVAKATLKKPLVLSNYDSNSEDEDDGTAHGSGQPTTDFFSLTSTDTLPEPTASDLEDISLKSKFVVTPINTSDLSKSADDYASTEDPRDNSEKTLVSNIMNLPKEEIIMKNKAAVGPKLPVPEQEYNVDQEGNVAFDEKAIEYLCGKRGIKRKNKEIEEANIIEINGEDIKPDEREWLVKALTEEPIQRPVSIGAGVNSQSKKKHQITYLAHQAKAMEMELKNQWAQNRMTRKQTQSKYGF